MYHNTPKIYSFINRYQINFCASKVIVCLINIYQRTNATWSNYVTSSENQKGLAGNPLKIVILVGKPSINYQRCIFQQAMFDDRRVYPTTMGDIWYWSINDHCQYGSTVIGCDRVLSLCNYGYVYVYTYTNESFATLYIKYRIDIEILSQYHASGTEYMMCINIYIYIYR